MPYVDTTPASFEIKLTEENFQEKFAELLTANGWNGGAGGTTSVIKKFYKASAAKKGGTWGGTSESPTYTSISIARHFILGNANGKMFGMALMGEELVTMDDYMSVHGNDISEYADEDLITMFNENKVRTSVYYYMLEKVPDVEDDAVVKVLWQEPKSMCLDIEVTATVPAPDSATSTIACVVTEGDPTVMQSPIVQSDIRSTILEEISYPSLKTNWWADSEIRLQGFIDENSIFAVIQADNVPAWENNIVPTVPFYFGEIDPIDPGDDAVAMFAGSVPPGGTEDQISEFDFNSTEPAGKKIMPILKNYPNHPSNGIDSVMLSRSKFGSRYQEYFLSWNTAPNSMPPDRLSDDGKGYPRAWNNVSSDEYKYQFNPSRYSGKVHTSKIYVIHPEEGVRGSLTKAIGLSALNFNAGKLRIRKQNCPEKIYDVYRFFMVGAVSPLTKRPATPYRPIGLGIYDTEYNPNEPTT